MATTGLSELKKARTRRLIADTAARLFAERGYEHVAVSEVAREAEVAEQRSTTTFRPRNSWSRIASSRFRIGCAT